MEKKAYLDNLSDILVFTHDKRVLTIKDVCEYTGLSRNTVKKRFPFRNNTISAPTLARELS